jgi:hypothetical protein
MIAGTFISALGTGGLALFVTEDSTYWLTVLPFTIAMGLGGAFAWPVFTSAALVDIEPEQATAVTPDQTRFAWHG